MNSKTSVVKGFTLIELLVVIAIVAILSVVVILSLNPAELLKQARDSNRFSDFATVKSAISLYLADVGSPDVAAAATQCRSTNTLTLLECQAFFSSATAVAVPAAADLRKIDAAGWVAVNFTGISSGSPLSQLPIDPLNTIGTTDYVYAYIGNDTNLTFKLAAKLESTKYNVAAYLDEGGTSATTYEVGTGLSM